MLQKAINEVKSNTCLSCGKPVKKDDIILLNPTYIYIILVKKNLRKRKGF